MEDGIDMIDVNDISIVSLLAGFDPEDHELLTMDGFDKCIIGVVERCGQPPIVCYDRQKVIDKLIEEGATYDDAVDFFEFNQIGAWMGESTPCFINLNSRLQYKETE